ncbi:hypothetical protein CAAN3_08S02762 [[Candida] anglica]
MGNPNLEPYDVKKLREKYSPERNVPPPQRGPSREALKQYKVFATHPQRLGDQTPQLKNPSSNDDLNVKNSHVTKPLPHVSLSLPTRSRDSLSPTRRSGSPIRRQQISEFEERSRSPIRKKQKVEEETDKRVQFNEKVNYNDTLTTSPLNDIDLRFQQLSDRLELKLQKFMDTVNERLDALERRK